jgi:ATP phosphoribosyltransferase
VSPLHHGAGYAVQIAAETSQVPALIPVIKEEGGSDIVVTSIKQLVA